MSYTPGPWTFDRMKLSPRSKDRRCGFVVNGPDRESEALPTRICDLRVPCGIDGFSEGEANARLIAAAPELLEALQSFLRAPSIGSSGPGSVTIEVQTYNLDAARNAIAKATR